MSCLLAVGVLDSPDESEMFIEATNDGFMSESKGIHLLVDIRGRSSAHIDSLLNLSSATMRSSDLFQLTCDSLSNVRESHRLEPQVGGEGLL